MDQMEHNVKIKDYKRSYEPAPFVKYVHSLNKPQRYPNHQEQAKMLDRFQQLHWQTDKISTMKSHDDKMYILRQEQQTILDNQHAERADVEQHRLEHLQGIEDNIQESRDRFFRKTQLERPGAIEKQLGDGPLYKIGKPIKY